MLSGLLTIRDVDCDWFKHVSEDGRLTNSLSVRGIYRLA